MNEQQLIGECSKGNIRAQKALYEHYAPLMMSICVRYVRDRDTAKDILQEGFIKVFTKIDSYSSTGVPGAWMRRIFVNTALEYLRNNKQLSFNTSIDDSKAVVLQSDCTIIENISADHLTECIAGLPDGYRTIFNLFAVEGYSHKEISQMLRIEEGTSRSQYQRARKALQKMLESIK